MFLPLVPDVYRRQYCLTCWGTGFGGEVSAVVSVESSKVVRLNDGAAEWTKWFSFSGNLS